jgi:hypothetical protein
LLLWMKQRDSLTCNWIDCHYSIGFVQIATGACPTKIIKYVSAIF